MKKHYQGAQNGGFSLLIALLFVVAFAGALASFTFGRQGENIRVAAEISGWQMAQLARAARIHVRNQMIVNPNLDVTLDLLGGGPQEIRVHDLINLSLLPQGFGHRINNNRYNNNLGQRMRVFMANHPVDGDPNDPLTVPTAYVYFENNAKSTPALIQDMVTAVRLEGVAVSAPLYTNGVNQTGDCNGLGDTVIAWDTGCLSNTEFNAITGDDFEIGSLLIPAWRSVQFDNRALMRFPQPEIAGSLTMTTPLEMGIISNCAGNPAGYIEIPVDDGAGHTMAPSEICEARDDNGTIARDNRRDIIGVNSIQMDSFLMDPQEGRDVRFNSALGTAAVLVESGPQFIVNGALQTSGDAKIFDGDVAIGGNLHVDRSITVSNAMGALVSARIGGNLNAGNAIIKDQFAISGNINVDQDLSVINSLENIPNIVVNDNMNVRRDFRLRDNSLTVNNQFVAGNLTVNNLTATNGLVATNTTVDNDFTNVGYINAIGAEANVRNNSRLTGSLNAFRPGGAQGRCSGSYCPRRATHTSCVESSQWLDDYVACMEAATGNTNNSAYRL